MSLLITVGSTLFQALSDAALSPDFSAALPALGISHLVVQVGSARVPDRIDLASGRAEYTAGARVTVLRYTADAAEMEGLIAEAEGVVSHAGSGTILGVLRRPKPPRLLVIPNPALMDNHQQELADELAREGYLAVGSVDDLLAAVRRLLGATPKPFPAQRPTFAGIMDELSGFT